MIGEHPFEVSRTTVNYLFRPSPVSGGISTCPLAPPQSPLLLMDLQCDGTVLFPSAATATYSHVSRPTHTLLAFRTCVPRMCFLYKLLAKPPGLVVAASMKKLSWCVDNPEDGVTRGTFSQSLAVVLEAISQSGQQTAHISQPTKRENVLSD